MKTVKKKKYEAIKFLVTMMVIVLIYVSMNPATAYANAGQKKYSTNISELTKAELEAEQSVAEYIGTFMNGEKLADMYAAYNIDTNYSYLGQETLDSAVATRGVYLAYSEYFSSVKWINRNGVVSLSITPKSAFWDISGGNAQNVKMARANHSFSLLKQKFGKDSRWKNEESLFNQYHCHVLLAGKMKTPWNIEPSRKVYSPTYTMSKGCNP